MYYVLHDIFCYANHVLYVLLCNTLCIHYILHMLAHILRNAQIYHLFSIMFQTRRDHTRFAYCTYYCFIIIYYMFASCVLVLYILYQIILYCTLLNNIIIHCTKSNALYIYCRTCRIGVCRVYFLVHGLPQSNVALCCSTLWSMVHHGTVQYSMVQFSGAQHNTTQYSIVLSSILDQMTTEPTRRRVQDIIIQYTISMDIACGNYILMMHALQHTIYSTLDSTIFNAIQSSWSGLVYYIVLNYMIQYCFVIEDRYHTPHDAALKIIQ